MEGEAQEFVIQAQMFQNLILQILNAQGFDFKRKKMPNGALLVEVVPKFAMSKLDSIPKMLRAVKMLGLEKNPTIQNACASISQSFEKVRNFIFNKKEFSDKQQQLRQEIEVVFKDYKSLKESKEKQTKFHTEEEDKDKYNLKNIVKNMEDCLEKLEKNKYYKKTEKMNVNFDNMTIENIINYLSSIFNSENLKLTQQRGEVVKKSPKFKMDKNSENEIY